jgi:hypothetical protein
MRNILAAPVLAALLALAPLAGPAAAQTAAIPDPYQLSLMIYGALTALDQANATGNYTVLRALASPAFQSRNSPEGLANVFAKYRQAHVTLAPIVLFQPTLTQEPRVGADGLLQLKGYFPTKPLRIGFDLTYQNVEGAWRLIAMQISPTQA